MRLFALILLSAISVRGQQFIEIADDINIGHVTYSPNYMAGGVSIFDYNSDGLEDIYLTGGVYPDHLYKNLGNGQFEDVSEVTGISSISHRYTMGVTAGDLDNDGFTDLFVTTFKGEQNICLRNHDGLSFSDVTLEAGFFGDDWSASIAMGDPDQDGDLDVYVTNFLDFTEKPFFRFITEPIQNLYFENLGNFKFKGASQKFEGGQAGCSLVATFSDIDRDGDPDLLLVNDFGYKYTPNEVYINDGGSFTEKAADLGLNAAMDGMGIAIGDVDENGTFDYYLSNVGDNIFYLNMQDESTSFNINDGFSYYSWGTFFGDFNNDSFLDLFVAKGSISESDVGRENKFYTYYPYTQNFVDVSALLNLNSTSKARGAAFGDLDNDGDLDIVVNNVRVTEENQGRAEVFINQNNNASFIQVELEGVESNRSAIGSVLELVGEDRRILREVHGGSSYLSSNTKVVHFGLGDFKIDSLNILWPSGLKQSFPQPQANARYFIKEGEEIELLYTATTSTKFVASETIKLTPNPADAWLSFALPPNAKEFKIAVIDLLGRKVNQALINRIGEEVYIDVSTLQTGAYFLTLEHFNSKSVYKFLVAR